MIPRSSTRLAAAASTAVLALAAGASAHATTLGDAIAYAYDTNPGLGAQRAALRSLDESYVQARAGYGLNIQAQAGFQQYDLDLKRDGFQQGGQANTKSDTSAVSITQPLYTGGRVTKRIDEATAQIKAGRENLRRFEQDLLARVVAAYVDVRRDEQLLKINTDTVTVLEHELSDTDAKFAVRQLTMTDVSQSRARLAQARTQLAVVQAQLAISRAQYLSTVGQNPVDLAPPPTLDLLPPDIDKAFESAEANNPQLQAAVYTEQVSRNRIAEARAGRLPQVTAQLQYSRGLFIPYQAEQFANTRTATVTLTQPIFTSGQISSVIRQQVEENNRDRLTIDDTRLQVTQSVSTAWEQLAATRKQLVTYEDEMRADEFAFYGVRQEEKFALRSTIEVLNAELELSNAQQNLVRTRAQEYVSRVQVLQYVGTLDARQFAAATPRYDPTKNLNRIKNIGVTPAEYPARILDRVLSPPTPASRPASIAVARPGGAELPDTPNTEAPIRSILSALDQEPARPPEDKGTAPDARTPPTAPALKPAAPK